MSEPIDHEVETVEVPVTRRARVTLIGRLHWERSYHVTAIETETGWATLAPGDRFVLRAHVGVQFRSGIGVVRPGGTLDLSPISGACHGDLLYRVEPA